MTRVKICGLTGEKDVEAAVELGADWIGVNFWPGSRRHVSVERAAVLAERARALAPAVVVVGVFVNQSREDILAIDQAVGLDRLQLHGDESPDFVAALGERALGVVRLEGEDDVARAVASPGPFVLVDTPSAGYGGSGRTCDWSLAARVCQERGQVWLAGGLTADNVARALAEVQPFGVDVASGVESSPGTKDRAAIAAFMKAVGR